MRIFWFGLLTATLFFFLDSSAQTDSGLTIKTDKDSGTVVRKKTRIHDPRRATLLSAVFPGAGQIYNRKYWKLPILYGGAFTLGYFINFNNEQYVLSRDSYLQVSAGLDDHYRGAYTKDQLVQLREYWRRNRDLLIIISGFTYLLNIADAAVDAHLSNFDVSDDLSLRIQPQLEIAGNQPLFGLGLALLIK
jgi:hypothetical protein